MKTGLTFKRCFLFSLFPFKFIHNMYAMAYDSKIIKKFCIYGILDVEMSNGRGDLPHPLNVMYPNSERNEIFPIS